MTIKSISWIYVMGYGPARPARNIYSTSSTLMLMIYTYPLHSSLTVKVNISTTSCQPVTLERCEYERNCEYLAKCNQWLKQTPELKFFEILHLELLKGYKPRVDSCFILQIASDFFKNKSIHTSKKTILSEFTTTCFSPFTPRFVEESKRVIHYTAFGFTAGRVVKFRYCREPSLFLEKSAVNRVNYCRIQYFCKIVNISGACDFCIGRGSHYFFVYRKILTPQSLESSSYAVNFFEFKTLNYNYEIQVSYLRVRNTTTIISSLQNLRLRFGAIKWQSPTNYEIFVMRLKNRTNCFREQKRDINATVRISITSTKPLSDQQFDFFRRETITRRNVELELSCKDPVKFVSFAGRFQIPEYEYISGNKMLDWKCFGQVVYAM